jgi:hypothetical protein
MSLDDCVTLDMGDHYLYTLSFLLNNSERSLSSNNTSSNASSASADTVAWLTQSSLVESSSLSSLLVSRLSADAVTALDDGSNETYARVAHPNASTENTVQYGLPYRGANSSADAKIVRIMLGSSSTAVLLLLLLPSRMNSRVCHCLRRRRQGGTTTKKKTANNSTTMESSEQPASMTAATNNAGFSRSTTIERVDSTGESQHDSHRQID